MKFAAYMAWILLFKNVNLLKLSKWLFFGRTLIAI